MSPSTTHRAYSTAAGIRRNRIWRVTSKHVVFGTRSSEFAANGCPCLSVEIEGEPNRRCQQFLLIGKKEPDLAPQCRNRDRDDVVHADNGIFLEPVAHTYWNFGRQAANCSGNRCDSDSGEVWPHELPGQDENRPSPIELGNVNWSQSISSSSVEV